MKKMFRLIDMCIQIALLFTMLVAFIKNDENGFMYLCILGFIQSISITYYCLFVKEPFTNYRIVHYYGTIIILSILFGLLTMEWFDVRMDSFIIQLLILISISSVLLGALYFAITVDAYQREVQKTKEQ
jgi:NADH:ubiquinone oxidoreductase subunit 6 (subunit J)